jgi:hypothetical protein
VTRAERTTCRRAVTGPEAVTGGPEAVTGPEAIPPGAVNHRAARPV